MHFGILESLKEVQWGTKVRHLAVKFDFSSITSWTHFLPSPNNNDLDCINFSTFTHNIELDGRGYQRINVKCNLIEPLLISNPKIISTTFVARYLESISVVTINWILNLSWLWPCGLIQDSLIPCFDFGTSFCVPFPEWETQWPNGQSIRSWSEWSGFEPWSGTLCCVLWARHATLTVPLSTRSINGYWRIVGET